MNTMATSERLNLDEMNHLIMAHFKGKYFMLDSYLYDKCTTLNKLNITAEQFGGKKSLCVRLMAPVVELSLLDSYITPESKVNCLRTTYDMIFAELKSALAESLSKHSDKELDIPIVDNKDVLPVLMMVIVKSKLRYLWSNIEYIKLFINDPEYIRQFIDDFQVEKFCDIRYTIAVFEAAAKKILRFSEESIQPEFDKELHSLSLADLIGLESRNNDNLASSCEDDDKNKNDNRHNLLKEQTERIFDLITTCTSANLPDCELQQAVNLVLHVKNTKEYEDESQHENNDDNENETHGIHPT